MDADLRRRLSAVVGTQAIDDADVVHPADIGQLRELLALGRTVGLRFLPLGHLRPSPTTVAIAADRVESIRLDGSSLLLHAGAAAPWAALRSALGPAGLAVAGLGAVRRDTVGASVAAGEVPHRAVAGVDILTPAGELISSGGRTLKDVVGYDLAGLAIGSGSALGEIVAVTVRLEPAGARSEAEPVPGPWRGEPVVDLLAAFGD